MRISLYNCGMFALFYPPTFTDPLHILIRCVSKEIWNMWRWPCVWLETLYISDGNPILWLKTVTFGWKPQKTGDPTDPRTQGSLICTGVLTGSIYEDTDYLGFSFFCLAHIADENKSKLNRHLRTYMKSTSSVLSSFFLWIRQSRHHGNAGQSQTKHWPEGCVRKQYKLEILCFTQCLFP